jgi:seryl-tRNA synthetase
MIRDNPEAVEANLRRRDDPETMIKRFHADAVLALKAQQRAQDALTAKNENAAQIGRTKSKGGDVSVLLEEAARLTQECDEATRLSDLYARTLHEQTARLPNLLADDVPDGRDETDNVVEHVHGGTPEPNGMGDKQHFEIGERLGMDFEAGVRLSGSRFTVLRDGMARMARALGQYMLDQHLDHHGYREVAPPVLVKAPALFGTGQFPKFADDVFPAGPDHFLAPTSEVMLTNLVAGEMLDPADLPLRFAALTDCFRLEAGSSGRDTRGLIRQHQFQKVELVSIVEPDRSEEEHQRIVRCAETILINLGLSFRRTLLCAGDTGFSAAKTYDLEVWMAGAKTYREISSVSNCRDFQARRMGTRIKLDKKTKVLAHTLNGSGVAVGRALAAVVEQYQDGDDRVIIPEVLRPYMGHTEAITATQ